MDPRYLLIGARAYHMHASIHIHKSHLFSSPLLSPPLLSFPRIDGSARKFNTPSTSTPFHNHADHDGREGTEKSSSYGYGAAAGRGMDPSENSNHSVKVKDARKAFVDKDVQVDDR